MNEEQIKALAQQLRQPEGEEGVKTGNFMNEGNSIMNRSTIDALQVQANDHILEIGMGNGFFVQEIVSKDASIRYTGCDFSPIMVEESQKNNAEWIAKGQAQFAINAAHALPFADQSFNKIFTVNTMYFWEDPKATFTELARVLTPDGILYISIRPRHVMETIPMTKYGFTLYSKEEAKALLENHGFKVFDVLETKEPEYEFKGMTMRLEHLILKARKP